MVNLLFAREDFLRVYGPILNKDFCVKELNIQILIQIMLVKKSFNKKRPLMKNENKTNLRQSKKSFNEITIIAAAAENDALGRDNKLIWHIKEDF